MDCDERSTTDAKILVGKPVIRGTRISVEFVIDLLASHWAEKQILENYPLLKLGEIEACLRNQPAGVQLSD